MSASQDSAIRSGLPFGAVAVRFDAFRASDVRGFGRHTTGLPSADSGPKMTPTLF